MELVVLFVLVGLGILAFAWWRQRQLAASHAMLLQRDGLSSTSTPCGWTAGDLVQLRACPRGDRRYGIDHGVTGPVEIAVAGGGRSHAECAAFVWWWEEKRTNRDATGHSSTSYHRQARVVGALRLPADVPRVSIAPEGVLTRWGLGGRGDFQVESEEFNRRFDVRLADAEDALVIRLLDPGLQAFLLDGYAGRHLELAGDVLLIAGDPPGCDPDFFGEVGELPVARRDVVAVAGAIPESFWRGLQAGGA